VIRTFLKSPKATHPIPPIARRGSVVCFVVPGVFVMATMWVCWWMGVGWQGDASWAFAMLPVAGVLAGVGLMRWRTAGLRRDVKRTGGCVCVKCGYCVAELPQSGVCPECGRAYQHRALIEAWAACGFLP